MNKYGEDWDKLDIYAKHRGIDVVIVPPYKVPKEFENDSGIYEDEFNRITLFTYEGQSLNSVCLTFMHELGHYLDFIHSGYKVDDQTLEAYEAESNRVEGDPPLPLKLRYYIYESECAGIKYMEPIWDVLKLKIPYKRVKVEQQLDIWSYKEYYLKGEMPSAKRINAYKKMLTAKYSNWRRPRSRSKERSGFELLFPEG